MAVQLESIVEGKIIHSAIKSSRYYNFFLSSMHRMASKGLYGARVAIRWLERPPEFRLGSAMVMRHRVGQAIVVSLGGTFFCVVPDRGMT